MCGLSQSVRPEPPVSRTGWSAALAQSAGGAGEPPLAQTPLVQHLQQADNGQQVVIAALQKMYAVARSVPDDWGRHVIQRLYGEQARTTFDLLELPSADRFGALSFGRSSKEPDPEPILGTLSALTGEVMAALDKIDQDVALSDAEKRAAVAMGAGTHAGGARPKLTLQDEDGIWLVKLNRFDDKVNNVRVEAAMHDLAARCGIDVPSHRVESMGDKDALLVRRFDRDMNGKGTLKYRTVSAATVFRADEEYARANFTG